MGIIQKACSLAQEHIWFERKVASDRRMVAKRLVTVLCNDDSAYNEVSVVKSLSQYIVLY